MSADHKPCYDTLFPPLRHDRSAGRRAGKVFSLRVVGPVGVVPSAQKVEADLSQWDDCLRCPEFDHCYKLCMARLALEAAERC